MDDPAWAGTQFEDPVQWLTDGINKFPERSSFDPETTENLLQLAQDLQLFHRVAIGQMPINAPFQAGPVMWNKTSLGLVLGTAFAGFSFWVDFLAILTLSAYEYKASPFAMAVVSAMLLIPGMLAGRAVGRWLDRVNPAPILLVALVLRASATVMLLTGLPFVFFCVFLAFRSLVAVPVEPANSVIVSRIVPKDDVTRYFGTLGLLRNVSKIIAPTMGTAIASVFGERASIGLSVVLTGVALASFVVALRRNEGWIGGPSAVAENVEKSSAGQSVTVSEIDLAKRPLLRQLLWTATTYAFMIFAINNQLPVMLGAAGFDKALLGVLVSCSGAGGILTAAYLAKTKRKMTGDPMRATVVAVISIAVCFVTLGGVFALPSALAPYFAAALFFLTGMFSSIESIRANVVVVQQFPESVGTVSGKVSSLQNAAMLTAPWVAAGLLPYLSMSGLFVLDGGLGLLVLATISGIAYWNRRQGETAGVAT
jgi:MFS family permease